MGKEGMAGTGGTAPSPPDRQADCGFRDEDRRVVDNRRVCAYLIDLLVLTPVLVVLVATLGLRDSVQMLCGAIVLTYFFVLEARSGQTIGKRAMKLRVMHVDGGPASATAIAGRTLLRIIDSHIGMFVVLLTGHRRQRIGDIAASTVVRPDDRPYAPLPHSPLMTIFPALVLGTALIGAWQLGLFKPGPHPGTTAKRTSDPYMAQVDQICERRVRQEHTLKRTETIDQVHGYSVAETQAIEELPPPPPASRRTYQSVLDWKHRLDSVGGQVVADVRRSSDPQATMNAEIGQWEDVGTAANERFSEYGLPYCAQ